MQLLETIWYVMFFHLAEDSCECSSRTLFFGIQETMFQTRCYAKKEKNENSREKNIELPIYIYNRKQTYKNTKTNICIEMQFA